MELKYLRDAVRRHAINYLKLSGRSFFPFVGCFWLIVLLLFYLVVGTILLPFLIIYLLCLCICYPLGCCKDDSDVDRPIFRS